MRDYVGTSAFTGVPGCRIDTKSKKNVFTRTSGRQKRLPLGPFSGHTRDRLHRKQTSLPLGPFSGYTRGQTTHKTDEPSIPLDPSQSTPGDRLHRNRLVFPWDPSQVHQGTDYTETDKPSWDPSQGTLGTDYTENRRAFPWDPSQGTPGDRLHIKQTSLRSPWTLLRAHQGTDYTETD